MTALINAHPLSWVALILFFVLALGGIVVGLVFGIRKAVRRAKNGAPDWYVNYDKLYYHSDFDTVQAMNRKNDRDTANMFSGYHELGEMKDAERESNQMKEFFSKKKKKMEELYSSYEDLLKSELKHYKGSEKWVKLADLMATVQNVCPVCGGTLSKKDYGVISHGGHMTEIVEEALEDTGIELETDFGQKIKVKQKVKTTKQVLVGATYDDWSTTHFDCKKCNKTIIAEKSFDMSYTVGHRAEHDDGTDFTISSTNILRDPQVHRKFLVPWYTSKLKKELPEELFNYIDRPHD